MSATRYFEGPQTIRCDAEPTCTGQTLAASIAAGRPGQRTYRGVDGPYRELTPDEVDAWRAEALVDDGAAWLCAHEMHDLLTARP